MLIDSVLLSWGHRLTSPFPNGYSTVCVFLSLKDVICWTIHNLDWPCFLSFWSYYLSRRKYFLVSLIMNNRTQYIHSDLHTVWCCSQNRTPSLISLFISPSLLSACFQLLQHNEPDSGLSVFLGQYPSLSRQLNLHNHKSLTPAHSNTVYNQALGHCQFRWMPAGMLFSYYSRLF